MNLIKIKILEVLAKHKNQWLKTKSIAKEVNLNDKKGINNVSVLLYRLRTLPYIERRSNSHNYQYRYIEDKVVISKEHPTNVLPNRVSKSDKKARGDRDRFNGFTFIELLPEVTGGVCEFCGEHTQISYKAEKDGCLFLLCERHGKAVEKGLCGYGGQKWA